MSNRISQIDRKTKETEINLNLNIDGNGTSNIDTGIPFFDHMLDLFTYHGQFDLTLKIDGDISVDFHHTVEDAGICLGQAFKSAIKDGAGMYRYASGLMPMDEALCQIAIDISNRPFLQFDCDFPKSKVGEFDIELAEEFFRAFVINAGITMHVKLLSGKNLHHMIEACFKGLGYHLNKASQLNPNSKAIPSTKGLL